MGAVRNVGRATPWNETRAAPPIMCCLPLSRPEIQGKRLPWEGKMRESSLFHHSTACEGSVLDVTTVPGSKAEAAFSPNPFILLSGPPLTSHISTQHSKWNS